MLKVAKGDAFKAAGALARRLFTCSAIGRLYPRFLQAPATRIIWTMVPDEDHANNT